MPRRPFLLAAALGLSLTTGCGLLDPGGVAGSGTAASVSRSAGAAEAISVDGPVQVLVEVGGAPSVEVTGDDNLLPLVRTTFDGPRLTVATSEPVRPNLPLTVRVTLPDSPAALTGRGGASLTASDLTGDKLRVTLDGGAFASLSGTARSLVVKAAGESELDALELDAASVTVDAADESRVTVSVATRLHAESKSGAHVRYRRGPGLKTLSAMDLGGTHEEIE